MARELSGTISNMFRLNTYERCFRHWRDENRPISNSSVRYIELPIDKEFFEMPVFAFNKFVQAVGHNDDISANALVAILNTADRNSGYKSIERCMKDILEESFTDSRLVKVEVKDGSNTMLYYGTHGAIFDRNFDPLMVASYKMEKCFRTVVNAGEPDKVIPYYKFTEAILRVNPDVYIYKRDPMEKFIVNKMISGCLLLHTELPLHIRLVDRIFGDNYMPFHIEIGNSPFIIHDTDTPSISTTNEQLIQTVIDHVEEVLQ